MPRCGREEEPNLRAFMIGTIREMTDEDITAACTLTDTEGWGFDQPDFRRIMNLWPGGSFVSELEGKLIGMITTSCYETTGWIGNVLVDETHRDSGLGTALVKTAIGHLEAKGISSILLYAYEGLEGFYEPFGFESYGSYVSYRGVVRASRRRTLAERMNPDDLSDVLRLDRYAFGDDRSRLLERILEEFPDTCLVLRSQGEVVGYAMAMTSDVLTNIGPVICIGLGCQKPLLESIGVVLDGMEAFLVAPSLSTLETDLGDLGLVKGFGVTRMIRGEKPEEEPETVLAIGALEKG